MTPLEFAKKYWELEAYFYPLEVAGVASATAAGGSQVTGTSSSGVSTEGWKRLRVATYRLGSSAWDQPLWQDVLKHLPKTVTVKVRTIDGATEEATLTASQARRHFHYPFVGKGSPEQAQIAIQLLYRYHKTVNTPEQFVSKNFIGLDCNGFVGNYIQRAVKKQPWLTADNDKDPGPTTLIGGLVDGQGRANQITTMDQLRPADTLIFGHCASNGAILDPSKENPTAWGHVMITEPNTLKPLKGGFTVGVVEATAAGKRELRSLDYTIVSAAKMAYGTVFKVYRGSPADPMDVRIARLAS